ncbi:MAG: ribosome small subunit-dependent GTPase A, partial [Oscillospiraceae bacterium]
ISPLAGDEVTLEFGDDTYTISEIAKRKNFFLRPPIANVDIFFIIVSTLQPVPSTLVIDKLAAIAVDKGAVPIIVITKTDLKGAEFLYECYSKSGIQIINAYDENGEVSQVFKEMLKGKLSVLCGNSGVGKSTLLNKMLPSAERETAQISKKLGRGKHTTREVEIFEAFGGRIADTPGFASLENENINFICKENLQYAFSDIEKYIPECKYTGCSHTCENGCAV